MGGKEKEGGGEVKLPRKEGKACLHLRNASDLGGVLRKQTTKGESPQCRITEYAQKKGNSSGKLPGVKEKGPVL